MVWWLFISNILGERALLIEVLVLEQGPGKPPMNAMSNKVYFLIPSTGRVRRIDSRDEGLHVTRVTQRGIIPPGPRTGTARGKAVEVEHMFQPMLSLLAFLPLKLKK